MMEAEIKKKKIKISFKNMRKKRVKENKQETANIREQRKDMCSSTPNLFPCRPQFNPI